MYQSMLPYQQNLNQFQMYGLQPTNAQHFVPSQPIQSNSPNLVPVQPLDGTFMPPMCLSKLMHPLSGNGAQLGSLILGNGNVMSSDPYSCNFLAQLEGSYKTGESDAEEIQVELVESGEKCANVWRQNTTGELVVAQLIYEDDKRFRLCALDGFVLAIMIKGKDMRSSVTWYTNDSSQIVWHRTGEVTFKLVTMTPDQSRRNSLASNYSGTSQMSYSQAGPWEVATDVRMLIRPELSTQQELSPEEEQTEGEMQKSSSDRPTSSYSESPLSESTSLSASKKKMTDDELFDQFRRYCVKCPSLVQKIIQWGITRTPNRRVGVREISELAAGRLWVRATLIEPPRGSVENWQEVLNELKGAYQEVEQGVYMQPPSQPNEPGKQHRLRKSSFGFWMVEEYNVDENAWYPCAQEVPYGHWVDLKDSRKRYNIQLLPMLSILNRMQDQWADHEEMEKSMEFLFKSCNQKKLNTRLKARNLKHNISNLRLKLEKQYDLSFAVRVAETADSIALGDQNLGVTEN